MGSNSRAHLLGAALALGWGATSALAQTASSQPVRVMLRDPAFFAVRVLDVEAAAAWYQEVFELELANSFDAEDGRYAIRILSGGKLNVELIEQRGVEPALDPHLGLFKAGIHVVDIEAFHNRLLALNVDADRQVVEDSALRLRTFVFRDPEGNRIQALQELAPPALLVDSLP